MTPFPNGTGPANADTGPPAPHAAAGTGGTSAIGGAHGRPCLSGAAFRRFTLPALLGLLLLLLRLGQLRLCSGGLLLQFGQLPADGPVPVQYLLGRGGQGRAQGTGKSEAKRS